MCQEHPARIPRLPLPALLAATAVAALAGCTGYPGGVVDMDPFQPGIQAAPPAAIPVTPAPEASFSYWNGDGVAGSARITIDLSDQAAYFYKGGELVGRSRVATGRSQFPTPAGSFSILEKKREKRSNLYGRIYDADGDVVNSDADSRTDSVPSGGKFVGASMPYWMRLTGRGVGMHAGPIPNPGRPASHGCIRLPGWMARTFYENVELGTPVEIVP